MKEALSAYLAETPMVNHEHNRAGRITDEQSNAPERMTSNRMRNGNQPPHLLIKDDSQTEAPQGDQYLPLDDTMMDNTRDAPRDSTGVAPGASMAEKLGGVDPTPGAPLDPVSVSGDRVSMPIVVIIGIVVLVLAAAILSTVI
jgi:hypothetical protein